CWYELAHDRLLMPVKMDNDAWYEKHLTPVEMAARAWELGGKARGLLLRREELPRAEEWERSQGAEPGAIVQEFLKESRRLYQKERDARRRLVLGSLLVCSLLALTFLGWLLWRRSVAFNQIKSHLLATDAQLWSQRDPDLGLLLAYRAWQNYPEAPQNSAARRVLMDLLSRGGGRQLVGHDAPITRVALTDRWLISASQDNTV